MITDRTTLSELQAIAAMHKIKSIRLRPDVLLPSRFIAEATSQNGTTMIAHGDSVASAIGQAIDRIAGLPILGVDL